MTFISRTIPEPIRRRLRQEVNFGCPVKDCGIPFLTYHHFDPPYHVLKDMESPTHNPNGIIALCHYHADQADGTPMWTNDQLREMKKNPYLTENIRSARLNFLRNEIVTLAGNLTYEVKNVLELDGERVIGFERDKDGYLTLNLSIKDSEGNPLLIMENNEWIINTDNTFDFKCLPQGKELEIISKDSTTVFKIRFDEYSPEKLKNKFTGFSINEIQSIQGLRTDSEIKSKLGLSNMHLRNKRNGFSKNIIDSLLKMIQKPKISVITVTGKINYRDKPIEITKNKFTYGGMKMQGNFIAGYSTLSFNNGSYRIGNT